MWQRMGTTERGDDVEVHVATDLAHAVEAIRTHSNHAPHLLFIAADAASMSNDDLDAIVTAALDSHCLFACTWGPGCERFHDCFDDHDVMRVLDSTPERPIVMTSWHDRESLADAVHFAMTGNCPDSRWRIQSLPCRFLLIGTVDTPGAFLSVVSAAVRAQSSTPTHKAIPLKPEVTREASASLTMAATSMWTNLSALASSLATNIALIATLALLSVATSAYICWSTILPARGTAWAIITFATATSAITAASIWAGGSFALLRTAATAVSRQRLAHSIINWTFNRACEENPNLRTHLVATTISDADLAELRQAAEQLAPAIRASTPGIKGRLLAFAANLLVRHLLNSLNALLGQRDAQGNIEFLSIPSLLADALNRSAHDFLARLSFRMLLVWLLTLASIIAVTLAAPHIP